MADSQGRKPGDPGYNAGDDNQNSDNGDGTFTDNQGNVMDESGGLLSAAPEATSSTPNTDVANASQPDNSGMPSWGGGWGGGQGPGYQIPDPGAGLGFQQPPENLGPQATLPVPGAPGAPVAPAAPAPRDILGAGLQQLLNALAAGNQAAAAEAARQFDATFGLDKDKFAEAIKEYNQNFGLAQAGLTGTYNGAPTLAAQKQNADIARQQVDSAVQAAGLTGWYYAPAGSAGSSGANGIASGGLVPPTGDGPVATLANIKQNADLSGMYNGAPTEAARQFNTDARLRAIAAIEAAHNDPFRQIQVEYGARGGGMLGGLSGETNALPQFGAMNGTAQGTGALGLAQGALDQIPGSNSSPWFRNAGPGGNGTPTTQDPNNATFTANGLGSTGASVGGTPSGILGKFRSPTDVVARNYITADKDTQNMITSAISANTGLSQENVDSQIKSTLPKQGGPTFGLASF